MYHPYFMLLMFMQHTTSALLTCPGGRHAGDGPLDTAGC